MNKQMSVEKINVNGIEHDFRDVEDVAAERQRAMSAEGELSNGLSSEVTRAKQEEAKLLNKIEAEVSRAMAAEAKLKAEAAETYLTIEAAEAEHESRLDAEQELRTAIAENRKEAAETYLTIEDAEAEHESRLEAEQELRTAIAENRAERITSDEAIADKIAEHSTVRFDRIEENEVTINAGEMGSTLTAIVYYKLGNKFVAADSAGNYWDTWDGMEAYMSGGKIREDKVYLCEDDLYLKNETGLQIASVKAAHYQGLSVTVSTDSVILKNLNTSLEKEHAVSIPIATDKNAGIITAYDKEVISQLDKVIYRSDDSFSIVDRKGNVVIKMDEGGFDVASTSYKLIDDSMPWLTICDEKGYVFYSSRKDVISNVRESLIKERSVAAVSWIDDDFNVYDDSGELRLPYARLREWSNTNGIYIDFATPPLNETKTLFAQELENEGFRFLLHPIHDGWYSEGGYTHDIVKVKKSLAECVRFHKHNFVGDGRILVWPGSSNKFTDNVEFVSQICDCAITATYDGTNHCADNSKYQLQRIAINGLSTTRTKTSVKEQIKRYIDTGDWVILYTHLYQATDMDTVDETTDSWANIKEIAEYANSLCRIRPTEVVWNERKLIYNF